MPSRSRQTGYRRDANGAANATSRMDKRFRVDSRAPQNHPRRTSKDKISPRCDAQSGFASVEGMREQKDCGMSAIPVAIEDLQDRSSTPPDLALPEVRRLLDAFQQCGIAYCYWKSSRRLPRALAGQGDLDLLVGAADWHPAIATALEMDFKLCPSENDWAHPAILSLLSYSDGGGGLVHLHLHKRLAIGDARLKNYLIPWEISLFKHAVLDVASRVRLL